MSIPMVLYITFSNWVNLFLKIHFPFLFSFFPSLLTSFFLPSLLSISLLLIFSLLVLFSLISIWFAKDLAMSGSSLQVQWRTWAKRHMTILSAHKAETHTEFHSLSQWNNYLDTVSDHKGENCSAYGKRATGLSPKSFHRYFYENTESKQSIVNSTGPQRIGRRCLGKLKMILSGLCGRWG